MKAKTLWLLVAALTAATLLISQATGWLRFCEHHQTVYYDGGRQEEVRLLRWIPYERQIPDRSSKTSARAKALFKSTLPSTAEIDINAGKNSCLIDRPENVEYCLQVPFKGDPAAMLARWKAKLPKLTVHATSMGDWTGFGPLAGGSLFSFVIEKLRPGKSPKEKTGDVRLQLTTPKRP